MLSRNNNKLLIHKLEPKKQRFAIRKISVGIASVLIGFTFAGFSGVSADEATTTTKDHLKTETTTESSSVPTKEVELTSGTETQAKEAKTTPVADAKAQVTKDVKEQAPTQTVTAKETSEAPTSPENQTVTPATEDEASETQSFNVEKQAEPQANVDLTDSKVAYAATPTKAKDQQEGGFSVTDPDYSKYSYAGTNLQTLIDDFKIDYQNSEYVFQWIASTNGEHGIVFTVDRGKDADGNVVLTDNGSFNAYEYYTAYRGWSLWGNYTTEVKRKKYVIRYGDNKLDIGHIINDGSRNTITVDHFYTKNETPYTPVFVGGHSGIEKISGNGYGVLSIYTPQVVEQKAKINNGEVYKTQTGLTGQHYTTGIPKNAKVEKGKFLYAKNSQGTMSEFHKDVVLVNNYHDGVTVVYKELDDQGTMEVNVYDNSKYPADKYTMKVGETRKYGNVTIANPYVQQTTDITYEYRKLGSVELYDENGNYLDQKQYVNDANDAAKASLPKVPKEFTRGNIEYTLVKAKDLPSDLSRSIKYIYRGIETKVTQDTYTLTTEFVNENGKELKAAEPQTITWTTTTKRDIHTNKITKQTSPSKESYAAVNSPVILGYYATTTKLSGQKAEPKNATQKIIYHKLGKIIAKDSQGNILTTVDYENAANDATKIKEIVAPTIKGHHVKGEVIQPSDLGQDTVLNYGQDTQVAQIKYWDETAQKYITDAQGDDLETIETGAHNTEISHKKVTEQIHALKAKGYEYDVTDQGFLRVYFDDDDSKIQTFTVKLVHGMQAGIESKQITREIHIHHPKQEEVVPQTAILTRNVTRDKVTDEVSPTSAWNFANFEEVDLPAHKGYKIDETPAEIQNGKVVAKTVTPDEEDGKKIAVKYIPLEQHALVKYVDDSNGTLLDKEDIQGVTDAAIEHTNDAKIATYRAKGYELVFDELANESDLHFNAKDEPQVFVVHLKHKLEKVTNVAELEKTVTRTITVHMPDGTNQDKTQKVTFTRTGNKDLMTGHITWSAWSPAQEFEAYTVPVVPGYTPRQTTVKSTPVTADDKDTSITIDYTANAQKVLIKYIDVDDNDKAIKSQPLEGVTDQALATNIEVPANYELVANQALPKEVTFKADGNEPIIVKVQHKHQDVTDEYRNDVKKQDQIDHTVTRTITIKHPHAADKTHTQALHFTRQVTRDMATGQDTFGEWLPENADFFEEFTVPTLASDKGYTSEKTKIARLAHITGATNDQREVVNFNANTQKAHVHYIDDTTGKKLEDVHVTGKTDEPIKHDNKAKVQSYLDKGYELVSDDFATAGKPSYNAEAEEQHFEVHLKHGQKDVTAEYKQDDKRKSQVERTIKREVIIDHPKEAAESYVQTAHFTRNVTRDMVTGEEKPGEWIPEENTFFEEVPVSLKASDKGYTPAKTKVDRLENISANTPDQKEVVEFTPNEQHALVKYVDDSNGTLLAEEAIQGVTDAAIEHTNDDKITAYQAQGYELVSDELANESDPHFNAEDEAQVYTVHLKHGSKVVKADPGNVNSQKEVKRMIIVNAPDGTKTTKVQTVVFTRDGSKDLVTGKISYPDWDEIATKVFPQDDVPQYLGYTSIVAGRKQTTIAARNVRPTDADQEIEVSYVARPSKQVITYQDENGNQIKTQVVTGHTDETVKLVPVLPDGWELTAPDSFPENVTFAPEKNQVLVITVKRITMTASAKTETSGENTELAKQEVVNDTTDVTTNEKNEATLPQMGENDSEALAVSLLGLVTAAFSLFYFGKERKKTDN
ncbi:YSIRK-type signal peptide-containing protein [Ligilactobacillus murinus]|uniref:YSIRK-type signal peptide-containing protein n=1 Tax=Ligilactobacillus murinus TaxID=1622 RepID=A0A4Q2AYN5_9LACO|nr:YSIRK-type signal peptide-containing protein [Ligilactobacillus murinus]NBH85576.1 YSIRK-type signal peptide-containing protein [Lachnospiraceae bacterium]MBF0701705.1 YSIRK-type signal peptide-containing protein [Ligilactobacillus murinus]MCR1880263.1 YSIRK-type signal peptide-containing protein [Ligilactobacillus murinus]NBH40708.1 YSIRK-type signal peptide-containing protein [Ligilactobacillus murinus]NYS85476.1 YSIRK-type signal peptide-containing protein [Ligilactobacillus murinus]